MTDYGSVIIPSDLAAAIIEAEEPSGWLGGGSLQSERVFAVSSAQIGVETRYTSYFDSMFPHRSWDTMVGSFEEKLIPWRKFPLAHLEKYRYFQWFDTSELASALSCESAELEGKKACFCIVEQHHQGPKLRAVLIESRSGSSTMLPMEEIMVPRTPQPYARIPAELTEALREKRVAVAGVGSGGAEIALNLACAGVGCLVLFDDDRLHSENYIRHLLGKRDLGRTKIAGFKDALRERNLPTKVVGHTRNIVFWADEFRQSLAKNPPDLLICATDSRDSRRLANLCSIGFGIPLVIAGILDSGRIGEIILVRPRASACYECIRMQLGAALEAPESDERPLTPYLGGEQNDLQSTALRFDVGFVSSLATRAALQILDPKSYAPLPADYVVWGREKSTEYGDPFRFELPLSLNYVPVSMRPDCPVCGIRPKDLEGIDVNGEYDRILAGLGHVPA